MNALLTSVVIAACVVVSIIALAIFCVGVWTIWSLFNTPWID